uniref:Uncharacterized protein n=1 Tax=Rhizophora mucronata TaxID=61149 RepID=A0A2P2MXN5_RHIMU
MLPFQICSNSKRSPHANPTKKNPNKSNKHKCKIVLAQE